MMFTSLIVFVACSVASLDAFLVLSRGTCPDIPVQADFDLNSYQGRWFSYEDFDVPYQFLLSCVTADYSRKSNGNIRVRNSGSRKFKLFGFTLWSTPVDIEGEARVVNQSNPAALQVSFGGMPESGDNKPNYLIVSTDYTTYSLVYSCFQPTTFPIRVDSAWILTRQRGVRPAAIDTLKLILRNYDIDTNNFKRVDHDDCNN